MTPLSLIVAAGPWDIEPWREAFRSAAGGRRVRFWPQDGGAPAEGPYVLCAWKADPRFYDDFPAPLAIFSLGAGVDHLHAVRDRLSAPVVRVVNPDLTMRMVEYVAFAVLYLHRQAPLLRAQQAGRLWRDLTQPAAADVRVGILGLGVLGEACGRALQAIGYDVAGWVRTPRPEAGIALFAGREGLGPFLDRTDVLVSLLPATPETAGLVDAAALARLGRDGRLGRAYFVNAGRGEAAVEADVIEALRSGLLAGAVLDVFRREPLPADSPLWAMDNVLVTPHVAADSNPDAIAAQIVLAVERLEAGEPVETRVDMDRGY